MPFSSKKFQDIAKQYEFTTEPSSVEYAQSNGKAENAVKNAKRLMKKAAESGNDFYLMLLEWRNTPSEGMDNSPSPLPSICSAEEPKLCFPCPRSSFNQRSSQVFKRDFAQGNRFSRSIITEAHIGAKHN